MKEKVKSLFATDPKIKNFALGALDLLSQSNVLTHEQLEALCDLSFCKELGSDYPILLKVPNGKTIEELSPDTTLAQRYYKNDSREILGDDYVISSQWYRACNKNPAHPENRLGFYGYLLEVAGFSDEEKEAELQRVNAIVNHLDLRDETNRYAIWKAFLSKWPADKVATMTLEEYNTYGAPYQAFCNWLEFWTEKLGSIWGGSAYKFGVFRQDPKAEVVRDSTHDGDGTYKWYKRYGADADGAFAYVKKNIVDIIAAVKSGDLKRIDDIGLGDAVKWKIAFLYQSVEKPVILPIYKRAWLEKLSGLKGSGVAISQMQAKLMSEKPEDMDIFDYSDMLGKKIWGDEGDVMKDNVRQIEDLGVADLDAFMTLLKEKELDYSREFVRRFIAAVQSKNFVVLTGLSGSGKTQLAMAFCQFIAENRHAIVSVGADWTNNEKMLGYPDAMKEGRYVRPETGVLDLVLRAVKDSSSPYVLVLDEMNLSHVERYFADFLSAMESKGEIKLHGEKNDLEGVPPAVKMPTNLWVIGTMNVDETTYMFSPKVLDRAQVLEFRVKAEDMREFLSGKDQTAADALNAFFPELAKVGAEFGYRTAGEFCAFVTQATKLGSEAEAAVDAAVMQKLLPKLHGSRRQLEKPLEALWKLCLKSDSAASVETLAKAEGEIDVFPYANNCKYPISAEKIARIFKNAKNNGFASYAEA